MKKKIYGIRSKELKDALDRLENETYNSTGIKYNSGGFATAEVWNYDDEYFDVELKWGIQNDAEDTVHTENYKIDRKTLEIYDV